MERSRYSIEFNLKMLQADAVMDWLSYVIVLATTAMICMSVDQLLN